MVKKYVGVIILCFFFTLVAWSEYYCSAENRHDALLFNDKNGLRWEVANMRFAKTPYLDSYLNCTQFIERGSVERNRNIKLSPL